MDGVECAAWNFGQVLRLELGTSSIQTKMAEIHTLIYQPIAAEKAHLPTIFVTFVLTLIPTFLPQILIFFDLTFLQPSQHIISLRLQLVHVLPLVVPFFF